MRLLGRLFFIIRKFRKKKQLLRSDLGMYDVIIIGAGVSGAATARELSRYKVKACVIEKEDTTTKRLWVAD